MSRLDVIGPYELLCRIADRKRWSLALHTDSLHNGDPALAALVVYDRKLPPDAPLELRHRCLIARVSVRDRDDLDPAAHELLHALQRTGHLTADAETEAA